MSAEYLLILEGLAKDLRWTSKNRAKTIYGGSDFSPVDWKEVTLGPEQFERWAKQIDKAVELIRVKDENL